MRGFARDANVTSPVSGSCLTRTSSPSKWMSSGSTITWCPFSVRTVAFIIFAVAIFTTSVAGNLRSRLNFQLGNIDEAEREFVQTLLLSVRLHYEEGVAYSLEGICAVSAAHGEAWRASALAVAAGVIRRRIGIFDVGAFTVHTPYLDILRGRDPDSVAAGEAAGAELSVPEAVRLALPQSEHEGVAEALRHW